MAHLSLIVAITIFGLARAGLEMCWEGKNANGDVIKYDRTCSKNCSQEIDKLTLVNKNCSQYPPRIDGDTQFFNCSIGGYYEIRDYRKKHPGYFEGSPQTFNASEIKHVELYYKKYEDGWYDPEMALKFNFVLPRGIAGITVGDSLMPQAILLRFESISDESVQDKYYYTCARERLFEFHDYKLVNTYDLENPRGLTYDCFVGLETKKSKYVYNITLYTAQGKSASYITTVVPRRENIGKVPQQWQPVIMTHLNITNQSLYVVVEKAPLMYNVRKYTIDLVRQPGSKVQDSSIINFRARNYVNHTYFRITTGGQYYIRVVPHCTNNCALNTTSYPIIYDTVEYPNYLDEAMDTAKWVAMVSGSLAGVMLVAGIGYRYLRRRKNHERYSGVKPRGYIIHPYGYRSCLISNLLSLIGEYCNCEVMDYLQISENTNHSQSRDEKIKNSLRESSFVLVICSNIRNGDQTDNNALAEMYSRTINECIERRKRSNNLRIIEIRFPSQYLPSTACILDKHRKLVKTVHFDSEPEQLYCKIHGTKKPPENNTNEALKSTLQWHEIMKQFWSKSNGIPNGNRLAQESKGDGLEPKNREDKDACVSNNNQCEHEPLIEHCNKKTHVDECFKQMKVINQDTDEDEEDFELFKSDNKMQVRPERSIDVNQSVNMGSGRQNIPKEKNSCSISTEADVHISLTPQNRPINNRDTSTTSGYNNPNVSLRKTVPPSEHRSRNFSDPTKTGRVIDDSDSCYLRREINQSDFNGFSERCLANKNMHGMRMPPTADYAPQIQILKEINAGEDSDDSESMSPVEQIPRCCHSSFQPEQNIHPHHQQFHLIVHGDGNRYRDIHPIPPDQLHYIHDDDINAHNDPMVFNGSVFSHQPDVYLADRMPNYERHFGQTSRHEHQPRRVNHCRQAGHVPCPQHLNGLDERLVARQQHPLHNRCHNADHYDHDPSADFHDRNDFHLPTNTQTGAPNFSFNPPRLRDDNIHFEAVDPPADGTHQTSVKERQEMSFPTRSNSSKSLPQELIHVPSDLDNDLAVNNGYIEYNPIPPDEEDDQDSLHGSDELFDQLLKINENGMSSSSRQNVND